jgi:hypothetical protein
MKQPYIRGILLGTVLIMKGLCAKAQIIIEPQLPSQGVVQQTQLWNLIVINNENQIVQGQFQISFQDAASGSKIFTATSGEVAIPKGVTQFSGPAVGAIHYEYFTGSGASNNGGLLPIGQFTVCYNLTLLYDKTTSPPVPECLPLTVEPFSPPQLVSPEDKGIVHTTYPVLNWISPLPANMFTNLNYKLIISEVKPGQAPAIAIQRNPLLFVQDQIAQTSYVYPSSYVALEQGKTYAWQIIAQNGRTYSAATDVWSFTLAKDSVLLPSDNSSYPHLQRGAGSSLFSAAEKIKFSYENESGDSLVNVTLFSGDAGNRQTLNTLPVTLKRGINFIDMDLGSFKRLQPGQEYILELINGRKENWDLRFKYEPDNN